MHAGDPLLAPVDPPAVDPVAGLPHRARFHMRRVRSMIGLGQAECGTPLALEPAETERPLLVLARRELFEHLDARQVADDAVLVLQIIVHAPALRRQMLADSRHPQVRPVLAPIFLRRHKAPQTRLVAAALALFPPTTPSGPPQALPV